MVWCFKGNATYTHRTSYHRFLFPLARNQNYFDMPDNITYPILYAFLTILHSHGAPDCGKFHALVEIPNTFICTPRLPALPPGKDISQWKESAIHWWAPSLILLLGNPSNKAWIWTEEKMKCLSFKWKSVEELKCHPLEGAGVGAFNLSTNNIPYFWYEVTVTSDVDEGFSEFWDYEIQDVFKTYKFIMDFSLNLVIKTKQEQHLHGILPNYQQ